jgi:hypothetical protein
MSAGSQSNNIKLNGQGKFPFGMLVATRDQLALAGGTSTLRLLTYWSEDGRDSGFGPFA